MKVYSIGASCCNPTSTKKKVGNSKLNSSPVSFRRVFDVEMALRNKGVRADFKDNEFVAETALKTAEFFEKYFGKSSLPNGIKFEYLGDDCYGCFYPQTRYIGINSNLDCFRSQSALESEMRSHSRIFLPTWNSTQHFMHTFVHEFGHSAHHTNVKQNNPGNYEDVWDWMRDRYVHDPIGRLITKFKLSKYANYNILEFMAERIAKDTCTHMTSMGHYTGGYSDVSYSDIFSRKWNCRYSSAEAYLDYYTQQIWNGNRKGADNAADAADAYLEEIERKAYTAEVKQKNGGLKAKWDEFWGENTAQATSLDEYQKLRPKLTLY